LKRIGIKNRRKQSRINSLGSWCGFVTNNDYCGFDDEVDGENVKRCGSGRSGYAKLTRPTDYKDKAFLNHTGKNASGWGYAVFGEVIEGMDVVDKMEGVPTGNRGGHQDVPKIDIVIEKAEVLK